MTHYDNMNDLSSSRLRQVKVVSFDVFDTLIARRYVSQRSLLRAVASSVRSTGLSSASVDEIYAARICAEESCRDREESREVTLDQIAHDWAQLLGMSFPDAEGLVSIEEALEYSVASAIPRASQLAWQVHDAGKELVYSSDTYHSGELIRSLLTRCGLPTRDARVLVSGELRKSKWRGDLFAEIVRDAKVGDSAVLHVGNNRHADFDSPRRAGLQARLIEAGNPTRYELNLDVAGDADSKLGPMLAGAAPRGAIAGRTGQ